MLSSNEHVTPPSPTVTGLMSGRSGRGRGRNRQQDAGSPGRSGSQSPGGLAGARHRQHQSATARWSSAPPGLYSVSGKLLRTTADLFWWGCLKGRCLWGCPPLPPPQGWFGAFYES